MHTGVLQAHHANSMSHQVHMMSSKKANSVFRVFRSSQHLRMPNSDDQKRQGKNNTHQSPIRPLVKKARNRWSKRQLDRQQDHAIQIHPSQVCGKNKHRGGMLTCQNDLYRKEKLGNRIDKGPIFYLSRSMLRTKTPRKALTSFGKQQERVMMASLVAFSNT